MSKVLFINGPSSGHINPTLGLVAELVAIGEEVVYFSSEEFRSRIEGAGASFRGYENFLKKDDPFKTKHFLSFIIKLLFSYHIVIPNVLEQIQGETFDYIIHDSMYGCGTPISEILNLPHISTCTSFINAQRIPAMEKAEVVNHGVSIDLAEKLSHLRTYANLSSEVSKKYGIKRPSIEEVFFNKGNINIVYTSGLLQPRSDLLDDSFKFVGYSSSDRKDDSEFPFELLKSERIIYISLGTIYNNVKDFYEICFLAFVSFPGCIVLSIGEGIEISSFREIPKNFIVTKHVPQLEILKYAHLFITHGGMGSTNEALGLGVPLIVIPMAADQPIVATRIMELGAGLYLNRHELTPISLRLASEQVISNSIYALRSAEIGESLRTAGGSKKAVQEILQFKEKLNKK